MIHRVVVAGAGVAALEAALALRAIADGFGSVELVAPEAEFAYRPIAVAAPFGLDEVRRFPLHRLAEKAGAVLRAGSVTAVDAERKLLALDDGGTLSYDSLLLATGARPREAVAGALTFRGGEDAPAVAAVLERATVGEVRRIVFAAPPAAAWPLPVYELALLAAAYLADRGATDVELVLATPEDRPLGLFGSTASDAVRELLELRGVRVETGVVARSFADGELQLAGDASIGADAVVALPALAGVPLAGVRGDARGFVATDEFGWVLGLTDVYAAGDLTQFPVKQGGIAAQQADAAASAIAADAGAAVRPAAFRPVLRGLLLTGLSPRFLRAEPGRPCSLVDTEPLWWPPAKIVGRYLAPFLAEQLGIPRTPLRALDEGAVAVDVALDLHGKPIWLPA